MRNAMDGLLKNLRENGMKLSASYMKRYRKYFDFDALYESSDEIHLEPPIEFDPHERTPTSYLRSSQTNVSK